MKRVICLCLGILCLAAPCAAQSVETQYFRAVLLPGNEVPTVSSSNKGTADVMAHLVRDTSGTIVSGTIGLVTHLNLTASVAVTGMDLWKGSAGQNGSLVLSTGITSQNSTTVQSGGDLVQGPAVVTNTNAAALTALRDLVLNPSGYYVNVITATSPNGAIRGQLQRAQGVVLLGIMSSSNLNPMPPVTGFGVAMLVAIGTRDASGNWTSGELFAQATYNTQDGSAFTSLQIHQATATPTSAAALTATLPGQVMPDPSGAGALGPYYTELTTTTATQTAAYSALFSNPSSLYIDLHTAANTGGLMLGALRRTDAMPFPAVLKSASELTAPSATATAPANFTLYTIRDTDGSVLAGSLLSDIDYSFAGAVQTLSTDLNAGASGQRGAAAVHLADAFYDATGTGNYYGWSAPIQNTDLLNSMVAHPENYYISMHTLADPGGAARAQLAAAPAGRPTVGAAISADLDAQATTLAPGGLFSLFGTNLVNASTDLSGWAGQTLPTSLNGLNITVAGRRSPLVFVSAGQVNAQLPVDVPAGPQPVVVTGPNGVSTGYTTQVAAAAPAIFFSPLAAVLKNADYSLVTASNPAKPGDVILVYCTGLGQTTPPLSTGLISASTTLANTAPVAATMGGKPATVLYSIASPSFPGLYQVAVTVPAGLTGSVPLVLVESGASSNSVNIALK